MMQFQSDIDNVQLKVKKGDPKLMWPLWTKITPLKKITDKNYTAGHQNQKHQFYLGY